MPCYCFKCPKCGAYAEEVRPMSDSQKPKPCVKDGCKEPMQRYYAAERQNRHVCDTYPYNSMAAGINPAQVKEFMKFDAEHGVQTTYNRDGEPEFRSAGHRKAYCEAHGIFDRNAGYSDPQRKH